MSDAQPPYGEPGHPTPSGEPPPAPQPYGQQPYGQQPYGQLAYGGGYATQAPHPQATTVLVLGILGLAVCGVLAPFAWVMGNRVIKEIEAGNGSVGGLGSAQAGRVCGIIGTVLVALGLLVGVAAVAILIAGAS